MLYYIEKNALRFRRNPREKDNFFTWFRVTIVFQNQTLIKGNQITVISVDVAIDIRPQNDISEIQQLQKDGIAAYNFVKSELNFKQEQIQKIMVQIWERNYQKDGKTKVLAPILRINTTTLTNRRPSVVLDEYPHFEQGDVYDWTH